MPRHHSSPSAAQADHDAPFLEAAKPSKTQLKKASHDLQALGEALLELPAHKLKAVPMPERLLDALKELRRIKNFEGRRRQLQYVGKLMRDVDPEPLREAVAAQRLPSARETLALHQTEAWRERLLADDAALTEWLDLHPGQDAQALRNLIRNARKDAAQAKEAQPHDGALERKGRAYRDLFQLIKTTLKAASSASIPDEHDDPEGEDEDV